MIILCIFIFTSTHDVYAYDSGKDYYVLYKKYKKKYKKYKKRYKRTKKELEALGVAHESLHIDYVQCLRVQEGVNPYDKL